MSDADITARLDLLIAITRIAHADALREAEGKLAADKASRLCLTESSDWITASDLKKRVIKGADQPKRTVERRISELVATGALIKRGSGPGTEYRNSGLFAA